MPINPEQKAQGGDVSGFTFTDVVQGAPIEVAKASYDPGYDYIDRTLDEGYVNEADLKRGFTDYGPSVGETRNKRD